MASVSRKLYQTHTPIKGDGTRRGTDHGREKEGEGVRRVPTYWKHHDYQFSQRGSLKPSLSCWANMRLPPGAPGQLVCTSYFYTLLPRRDPQLISMTRMKNPMTTGRRACVDSSGPRMPLLPSAQPPQGHQPAWDLALLPGGGHACAWWVCRSERWQEASL